MRLTTKSLVILVEQKGIEPSTSAMPLRGFRRGIFAIVRGHGLTTDNDTSS